MLPSRCASVYLATPCEPQYSKMQKAFISVAIRAVKTFPFKWEAEKKMIGFKSECFTEKYFKSSHLGIYYFM